MSHTKEDLKELQNKTLEEKIQISTARIIEWYEGWEGQVYMVPVSETSSTKILRFEATLKQPNISWAKDYTFEEVLKRI